MRENPGFLPEKVLVGVLKMQSYIYLTKIDIVVRWLLFTVDIFCVVLQYGYLIDPPGVDLEDVETSEKDLKVLEVQC